jgi:hypothetical protein
MQDDGLTRWQVSAESSSVSFESFVSCLQPVNHAHKVAIEEMTCRGIRIQRGMSFFPTNTIISESQVQPFQSFCRVTTHN